MKSWYQMLGPMPSYNCKLMQYKCRNKHFCLGCLHLHISYQNYYIDSMFQTVTSVRCLCIQVQSIRCSPICRSEHRDAHRNIRRICINAITVPGYQRITITDISITVVNVNAGKSTFEYAYADEEHVLLRPKWF